ncbi:hypothetical protein J6590_015281 [Homalodisca vitripennis]|nr:hypothetical protein J6590_015281 [Homalodisca vitripennis]
MPQSGLQKPSGNASDIKRIADTSNRAFIFMSDRFQVNASKQACNEESSGSTSGCGSLADALPSTRSLLGD